MGLGGWLLLYKPGTVDVVIPPVILPEEPPEIIYPSTVFGAISALYQDLNVGSFVLEKSKLPYVYISKSANVLSWKDSCLSRYESGNYNIHVYTETLQELLDLLKELEDIYNYGILNLTNEFKRFINIQLISSLIQEEIPQLFHGILIYEIIIEKITDLIYINEVTYAKNIFEAITKRFDQFHTLNDLVTSFVTSKFSLEKTVLPYITIPDFVSNEDQLTTKSRIEALTKSFCIYAESLTEIETIQDEICRVFDYCHLILEDKYFLVMEWLSDSIIELMPQLWKGTVDYEILLEKDIV